MSSYCESATVQVQIRVDTDLETDDSGTLYVVSYVSTADDEEGNATKVPLEDVVDNIIEFYEASSGSNPLYVMAHEMTRMAEKLRTTADNLEGHLFFEDDFPPEDDVDLLER